MGFVLLYSRACTCWTCIASMLFCSLEGTTGWAMLHSLYFTSCLLEKIYTRWATSATTFCLFELTASVVVLVELLQISHIRRRPLWREFGYVFVRYCRRDDSTCWAALVQLLYTLLVIKTTETGATGSSIAFRPLARVVPYLTQKQT